ncbi:hypothetical protein Tco_0792987 [Tanacetum coccineum]
MKMEILLESTSNMLMGVTCVYLRIKLVTTERNDGAIHKNQTCSEMIIEHAEYDESNTYVLERFNTSAGNPVKKILLKLNLSDHRLCKMVVECQSVKVKEFQERCNIKAFQEWYEHVGPEVASPQDGKVTRWRRDCAWLMISRCSRSQCQIQVQGTSSIQEVNDHYNIFTRESQEYELKTKDKAQYARLKVKIDDPNITMEEYIRLEEEKARRRAIVLNDALTSEVTLCEPTVSPLKDNKIDFRLSFDEFNDEDYMVIYDKNLLSYKIISVNNLKTDSKNDNDKVNMPSFPSLEPTVSYFDDLDYFKDFEKEFPAIVYNDALTSKLDFLTEPTDNDDEEVDIEHSSGDLSVKPLPDVINTDVGAYAHGLNKLLETRPRERNIDEHWWRIYKSGDLKVLES